MKVENYLFFEGQCDEALKFYRDAVGAEVEMILRYKDSPEPGAGCPGGKTPPGDKIMHASFMIGETRIMASDGMCSGKPEFKGFSLSIEAADEARADKLFAALSAGGNVVMPLGKTFFSPHFGMVADKFGVHWMVIVPQ